MNKSINKNMKVKKKRNQIRSNLNVDKIKMIYKWNDSQISVRKKNWNDFQMA